MLKAVLIDIDNTMVLFDEPEFYKRYFKHIAPFFRDFYPPKEFLDRLIRGTRSLKNNDGSQTNVKHFLEVFSTGDREARKLSLWRRFQQFYAEEYGQIAREAKAPEGLLETLIFLKKSGVKLVAASNPIFPEEVHIARMDWVGIQTDFPWDLITHVENMSFVKPRSGYYREISTMIGLPPECCLMVGNDALNDMAAGRIGMKTYLTTDISEVNYASLQLTVEQEDSQSGFSPDFTGPFSLVPQTVANLMGGSSTRQQNSALP
jgi:FMN phosphatase YigB (HAD superfamily)